MMIHICTVFIYIHVNHFDIPERHNETYVASDIIVCISINSIRIQISDSVWHHLPPLERWSSKP